MRIRTVDLSLDDVVVLVFEREMGDANRQAALLRDCLGARVHVVPLVGCSMISVVRAMLPNDPSSATRRTRAFDCNRNVMAGFAAAHG